MRRRLISKKQTVNELSRKPLYIGSRVRFPSMFISKTVALVALSSSMARHPPFLLAFLEKANIMGKLQLLPILQLLAMMNICVLCTLEITD